MTSVTELHVCIINQFETLDSMSAKELGQIFFENLTQSSRLCNAFFNHVTYVWH